MGLAFDAEYVAAMEAWTELTDTLQPVPVGDVATRRLQCEGVLRQVVTRLPMPTDVTMRDFETEVSDGTRLLLRWYTKDGYRTGSGVFFIHGGGMIMNDLSHYDRIIAQYVSDSGAPFLAVEYRKAPEYPAPTPAEDCYAGLVWMAQHCEKLGIDRERIAVMGESAGGGLAAAIAIMARDRSGPEITQQILLYPMLDDRNTVPRAELVPFVSWSYEDNVTAWSALLGEAAGGSDVSPYAAPARLVDPSGLPPLYIDLGELDIFVHENLAYTQLLASAGVSTEVHVHSGLLHAWELFCPHISSSLRAREDRLRILRSL